ncbi:MAG: HAMP domain-containing histidine kinase [Desulfovibrio sp.]|nr:HAMP domain-containing histidine kinase [Desulfovibrio sp.]
MAARHGIFTRLLVAFGLYAAALAAAMGAACWYLATDVSLDVLARRLGLVLTALREAEEHARSGRESPLDARELITSLDMDFLVGKEVPPPLAALGDGIHVVEGGTRYVYLSRSAEGLPLAITGPISARGLILKNIVSFFCICLAAGLVLAPLLALAVAHRLARPLRRLARALGASAPDRPCALPESILRRQDEIGFLGRTIARYAQAMRAYAEREKFFAGAASHELRTPLTVMAQTVELLEDRAPADRATAAALKRLARTTRGMSQTVAALLTLARSEKQEVEEVNPGHILMAVVHDLLPGASCKDEAGPAASRIVLPGKEAICITGEAGSVRGSPDLGAVVVRNLVENALRHRSGGDIHITLAPGSLEIANRGRFSPEKGGSSGFGLIIAQRACERMGWRIERAEEGEETRFRLTFPAP